MTNSPATHSIGTAWSAHVDETKRGLAKLLAREDITVRHEPVETAMFDVKNRDLILPTWENITVDQYDLLIGHEVGHAKYTDDVTLFAEIAKFPGLFSYVNVIEDARIERRMKEEYPGLRASFRRGYADFFSKGPLFQNMKPAASYTLIDRLNIHFKLGAHIDVPFTAAEQTIVGRVERLRSFREAYLLAKELWQAQKEQNAQNPQSAPEAQTSSTPQSGQSKGQSSKGEAKGDSTDQSADGSSESESDESESESNGSESGEGSDDEGSEASEGADAGEDSAESGASQAQTGESAGGEQTAQTSLDPMSETDAQNREALRKMGAEAAANYDETFAKRQLTLGVLPTSIIDAHTVTNPQFVADMTAYLAQHSTYLRGMGTDALATFKSKYDASVKYLASEFDRRKTAKLMDRVRVSRTGRLDVNKLHAYKFRDDLFKSALTTPKGQSHGIVAILDGSGSMGGYFKDVLHQAMFFGAFAQRLRIPFQAYLFLSKGADVTQGAYIYPKGQIMPAFKTRMVCILDTMAKDWNGQLLAVSAIIEKHTRQYSSTMTRPDWNDYEQARQVGAAIEQLPHSKLGSTPLYSSLLLADRYVAKMKSTHKLDKMTVLVVTDGEDSDGLTVTRQDATATVYDPYSRTVEMAHTLGAVVRDTLLRRTFDTSIQMMSYAKGYAAGQIATYTSKPQAWFDLLVTSLRLRHDARIILLRLVSRPGKGPKYVAPGTVEAEVIQDASMFVRPTDATMFNALNTVETAALIATLHPSMRTALREEGGTCVLDATKCIGDANIMVATDALRMDDDDFTTADTSKLTTRQIAKKFMQSAEKAQSNKVFVKAVVPFLI